MAPSKPAKERRQYPRLSESLEAQVQSPSGTFTVPTVNISANGVCFRLPKAIPAMTKMDIKLSFPSEDGGREGLTCNGVVVRSLPDAEFPGQYKVSIFFNSITPASQKKIARFVASRLGN